MTKQLNKTSPRPSISSKSARKLLTASEAAQQVLHEYRETFRDLARYDRGEKPLDTISY